MIHFGCFAYSKLGGIRSLLLQNRNFCDKIFGQNSFDSTINEIKQSLHKLESQVEQQNKLRNRQSEKQLEEIVANFDELKKNYGQFERKFYGQFVNKLASLIKEMEEGNKEMKEAFDKFECNLRIAPMKNNTWNSKDCGPKLTISGGGLEVKNSGRFYDEQNCVRAALPILEFNLAAKAIIGYFEVEILNFSYVHLGFCSKQFPLEDKELGCDENSIGFEIFEGDGIFIEESKIEFEEDGNKYKVERFKKGDVIGLGMINSQTNGPMKCFATCNGKLLGMVELPDKFAHLQLFPAVNLLGDVSIKANFGANEWRFNPRQLLE